MSLCISESGVATPFFVGIVERETHALGVMLP